MFVYVFLIYIIKIEGRGVSLKASSSELTTQ